MGFPVVIGKILCVGKPALHSFNEKGAEENLGCIILSILIGYPAFTVGIYGYAIAVDYLYFIFENLAHLRA